MDVFAKIGPAILFALAVAWFLKYKSFMLFITGGKRDEMERV